MESISSSSDIKLILMMGAAAARVSANTDNRNFVASTMVKYRGGSRAGKSENRNFSIEKKGAQLNADFFCRYRSGTPIFTRKCLGENLVCYVSFTRKFKPMY